MAYLQFDVPYGTVALTGAAAQSVVGLKAPTNQVVKILEAAISFDGANSANAPAVVDFGNCTFATNGPGTNSTSVTPAKRDSGRGETIQSTAGKHWTTEPTVITANRTLDVGQFNGIMYIIHPFASPHIVVGGGGFVIRANSPNNVNCSGHLCGEE